MKNLFLLLSLTVFSLASAQINFEKGYFIKKTGEKVSCYIKNMYWKDNPISFEYKNNIDEGIVVKEYLLSVSEFGIDSKCKYVNETVNIDRSSSNTSYLNDVNQQTPMSTETLFLKVLVEGDANLYSYNDVDLTRYFIKTKDTPVVQLIHFFYLTQNKINFDQKIEENNTYRQQLFNSLQCDKLNQTDFENSSYDKSSFTKIITKYNNCKSNSSVSYESKSKTKRFAVKFTPSINIIGLKVEDPDVYYNKSIDLDPKIIFNYGIEIEYILPFNNNKWRVYINPTYEKYETDQTYISHNTYNFNLGSFDLDITNNLKVTYSGIQLPVGLRYYMFLTSKSKIFINTAFVYSIAGKSHFNFNDKLFLNGDSTSGNFTMGVGFNYNNRYSIEFKLNTSKDILELRYWKTTYSNTGLVLGYRFL